LPYALTKSWKKFLRSSSVANGTTLAASGSMPSEDSSVKLKQFAALPYRMHHATLEVLLITTRKKRQWSVPKGWRKKRSSPQQAAAAEAYEEAGVFGHIGARQIGRFKNRRLKKKKAVFCDVRIFSLRVKRQASDWPERDERDCIWVPPLTAAKLVKKAGLRRAIERFESKHATCLIRGTDEPDFERPASTCSRPAGGPIGPAK
jgi:8-oxo-dGTP pyrophosphatase MutT (NUDIX family)